MRKSVIISLGLTILILAVYLQVGTHQFLNYDDNVYVTGNPHVAKGLAAGNLSWALTSFEASNWHPVTWLSHMADVQLFGMSSRAHHLSNVALHLISSLLLFLLLKRSTGGLWQSAFVAALFALHPMHVESVAWVAERKDVLSAFFGMVTLILYCRFAARPKTSLYLGALCFFALGLMSKPMLVTLPLVMLLLDYWPLQRFAAAAGGGDLASPGPGALSLLREKIPFFACSLLLAAVTIYAQHRGGATQTLDKMPLAARLENALTSYASYLGKTLWPHDLAVFYPFPSFIPLWKVAGALVLLTAITAAVLIYGRKQRYLVTGWGWFLITLLPVIGIIQVGVQAMADRYSYLPSIGLFVIAAWGLTDVTRRFPRREALLALLGGATVLACAFLTWQQVAYWQDSVSLYRHALQVNNRVSFIHNNLALALMKQGNLSGALQEYREALLVDPDNVSAHNNFGLALVKIGDLDGALQQHQEAVRIKPRSAESHSYLGVVLARRGNLQAAIGEFRVALEINPELAVARNNLGIALASKGELDAALEEFDRALRINPDDSYAYNNKARALAQKAAQGAGRK
jgi:protein O-mannosyl-transferase